MSGYSFESLFHLDALAQVLMALVGFIGLVVWLFARRYMQGDQHYHRFLGLLVLLVFSVMTMAAADHLLFLLFTWGISNVLLVCLMVHKAQWKAARASGWVAARIFLFGFILLSSAFALLFYTTGATSVQTIVTTSSGGTWPVTVALILMGLAAMVQSAIWPFHGWLLSSLNSPTPVSAIMHAGLVNGGGFLLVRFAPLYINQSTLLMGLFVLGIATALIGTFWKLMQPNIKRMLACSTMGQMGFMLAQCGLGLFPAAVAHLCWHGMFKAFLFLGSGSAAQEKRLPAGAPPDALTFLLALACGLAGSYGFALASHQTWIAMDTTLVLTAVAFIAGSQFALTMLPAAPWKRFPLALILTSLMGGLYGSSVWLVEIVLEPLHLMQPQPLHAIHLTGVLVLGLAWVGMVFGHTLCQSRILPRTFLKVYVNALNASQPHPDTITTHRNTYRYV